MIVLDASALLAFMFQEPGHDAVASVIDTSCISAVNVSEVIGRFTRDGHDHRMVFQHLERSPVEMVPFLPEDGALTAALVPATLHFGLVLGDRACLALAISSIRSNSGCSSVSHLPNMASLVPGAIISSRFS